jgi:hypothetical protein
MGSLIRLMSGGEMVALPLVVGSMTDEPKRLPASLEGEIPGTNFKDLNA